MSQPTPTPPADAGRLLVVDDNAEGRQALERVLTLQGYHVTGAADGTSALAALEAGSPFDAVLVDLLLPDMDGLEIAKAASSLDPRPRIALITGWSFEANLSHLESCRIDQVFHKPVSVVDLVAWLRKAGDAGGRA
jgi:CheY-like chemotaxis protein